MKVLVSIIFIFYFFISHASTFDVLGCELILSDKYKIIVHKEGYISIPMNDVGGAIEIRKFSDFLWNKDENNKNEKLFKRIIQKKNLNIFQISDGKNVVTFSGPIYDKWNSFLFGCEI